MKTFFRLISQLITHLTKVPSNMPTLPVFHTKAKFLSLFLLPVRLLASPKRTQSPSSASLPHCVFSLVSAVSLESYHSCLVLVPLFKLYCYQGELEPHLVLVSPAWTAGQVSQEPEQWAFSPKHGACSS